MSLLLLWASLRYDSYFLNVLNSTWQNICSTSYFSIICVFATSNLFNWIFFDHILVIHTTLQEITCLSFSLSLKTFLIARVLFVFQNLISFEIFHVTLEFYHILNIQSWSIKNISSAKSYVAIVIHLFNDIHQERYFPFEIQVSRMITLAFSTYSIKINMFVIIELRSHQYWRITYT